MSGRFRTVVIQALGVAIIAAVVFVLFLRPTEPGELSGIDVPNGGDDGPRVVKPGPPGKHGNRRDEGDKSNGTKGGNVRHNGPSAGPADGPGSNDDLLNATTIGRGGLVFTPPDLEFTPPDDDGGPDDDQYTDLVSTLMKDVGEPTPFREINQP
jgi:hypothetical protein